MGPIAGGRIDIPIEPDLRGFDSKLGAGLRKSTGAVGNIVKGLGVAVAAGTALAVVGLKKAIDVGREYQDNLNELQAVTQATAIDMRKVGDTAKALGADMSLPATSAADAAAAMVELAKGGLSVNESMKAAKGTLQLAAAAQIDAAQAAEIQSNALNEFGLSADQAGHVADVLANTANAASGSIVDMANALKFVGPVAKGLSISIDNTSAALGLLANNGIKGEQAGTSLRGILASLASPSVAAAKALKTLGVVAFDNQGKFVGLRTITDQLAKAKGKLSEADFAAAASTAFGNEGFTAANALAQEGAKAFDEMAVAVGRAGGASDVAAAKTKGLGGAIEGFNSQVETAGIGIFEKLAPTLEKGVRAAADVVAKITPAVVSGIDKAIAAGQVFGPRLADAIKARGAVVGTAVHDVLGPIAETVPGLLNAGLNTAIGLWEDFTGVLHNAVEAAKPAAKGIADVAKASIAADGPVSALGAGVGLLGDAAGAASTLLIPIGKIVGGIASAFAGLPGPIQTAVIALGLTAAFKGRLETLGDTVKNRVTAPFKNMGEEIRLQQALLTGSTNIMSAQVGKVGLAMAALESRVPTIGKIADAYRNVSTATEGAIRGQGALIATSLAIKGSSEGAVVAVEKAAGAIGKLSGAATGAGAALGTGLKSAAGGLVSFLGGPWGVAIAAAGVGLSLLASKQQRAAASAAEHQAKVRQLGDTLDKTTGAVTSATREFVVNEFVQRGIAKVADRLGVAFRDVVDAALGVPGAMDKVRNSAAAAATANTEGASAYGVLVGAINIAKGATADGTQSNKEAALATDKTSSVTSELSAAMGVLADKTSSADQKTRALKEAFDALSGGQVGLESAQSRLNEKMDQLRGLFTAAEIASKGFVGSLVTAEGKFNIATDNGRKFRDSLSGIAEEAFGVAQRTFDVTGSMDQAKGAIQTAREQVIKAATDMGLSATQAGLLADSMHLIPGEVATIIKSPGMSETQVQLDILKGKLKGLPPNTPVKVDALTADAVTKLEAMGFKVTHLPNGQFEVIAKTAAANDELNGFVRRWNGFTIQLNTSLRGGVGGNMRAQLGFAKGGLAVPAYAAGGLRELTPMRGGVAQIVPPDSWRIIGDRMRDDEAYIPINNSARSLALLQETARRLNHQVIRRFAVGAVTGRGPASGGSSITFAPDVRVFIGDRELTDLVRVEIRDSNRATRRRVLAGAGGDA